MEEIDLTKIDELEKHGPIIEIEVNGTNLKGLIDTGAAVTCISSECAEKLGLTQTGTSWHDQRNGIESPIYKCSIVLQQRRFEEHEIRAFPLASPKNHQLIIGRDLLTAFTLTYIGHEGRFTLM